MQKLTFITVASWVWRRDDHIKDLGVTFDVVHVVDAVLHYTLGFAKLQWIPKKTVVYYDYIRWEIGLWLACGWKG